ncbi:Cytochrome b5-like heme/steroid binding domain [Dillenia turbinata]|uniref:Cytochrome b5-like heme/steroid binding domain n=1 Tax=Dillenia turbinata TaxID=194707 RepID=A0AAN8ZDY9_9MAGN
MPTLTKLYSMHEASQHNTKNDCWIVIDGKVYDVSTYLDDHPGGDDVLLEVTGKDAKEAFEDAGHSQDARELMETFCIGELESSMPELPELKISTNKEPANLAQRLKDIPVQYWAVPVAVVGVSLITGFFYLRRK